MIFIVSVLCEFDSVVELLSVEMLFVCMYVSLLISDCEFVRKFGLIE